MGIFPVLNRLTGLFMEASVVKFLTNLTLGKKISVLLVDDEPQLLRLVRANLEAVGYRVLTAMDARSVLKL